MPISSENHQLILLLNDATTSGRESLTAESLAGSICRMRAAGYT